MLAQTPILVLFGLLAFYSQWSEAVVSINTPISGFATFYGGPQDGVSATTPTGGLVAGACGYESLSQAEWPFWNVVAIGPNNPIAYKGNKKGCGYCILAECQGEGCGENAQPVTMLVTDACESCAPNQLNLNALTFQNNFNSDLTVGRVNITFQQADCTPPGNMLAKTVKSRPNGGNYIGFALMAVAGEGTITAVDIKGQGDAEYLRMSNLYGDVWEASLFGDAPLSLWISDNYGATLEAPDAITSFDLGVYDTGVQFTNTGAPAPAPALTVAPAPAAPEGATSLSPAFQLTEEGTFCDQQCFASGLTASQFKKLGTTMSTFACGVSETSVGAVSGYQLSNGTATCSVAAGSDVESSADYGCLCQNELQTQGLQPYNGTSCGDACQLEIDGMTGAAVPVDSTNSTYVCVPISETSLLNRFGYTLTSGDSTECVINSGAVATSSEQFSCFCLFTSPTAVASSRRLF